ncbi:MAG: calcium/sodium antiporter [Planctomycetes bacterium]|nr:calcium/sodium antiporter [Planctomycetota bacterium]
MDWFWIALGLATLIAAADLLVRGSVWCALALGLSPMLVGLTLVAFGTSAPELVVSVTAALDGKPGFATGAVFGSNIANIGLIVGLSALLSPIRHAPRSAKFEVRYLLLTAVLGFVPLLAGTPVLRSHGIALLGLLVVFTLLLIRREQRHRAARRADPTPAVPAQIRRGPLAALLHVAFVAVGLVGLKFGGEWLVVGATGVARELGMSEVVIGMTIIAVGTSLPELATSLIAARKGHGEIALGNVLGSNVFNLCMVLGATAVISPVPMSWSAEGNAMGAALGMSLLLAVVLRYSHGVGRAAGALLLVTYAGYVAAQVLLRPGA